MSTVDSSEHYDAGLELIANDAPEEATAELLAAIYLELKRSNDLAAGVVQGERGELLVPRCQTADVRGGETVAQCSLPAGHGTGCEDEEGNPVHPTRRGD